MNIKNKTQLRDEIKHRRGTTGELDKVHFYEDGEWDITSANTSITWTVCRSFRSLTDLPKYGWTIDQAISYHFREIEDDIDRLIKKHDEYLRNN